MTFRDVDYPELVKFLLILSVNRSFKSTFMDECHTREERHDFLRRYSFNPSLILSELREYCARHAHLLDNDFSGSLANLSESESLSSALSGFSSQQMRTFVQDLLQSSCSPSYMNPAICAEHQSARVPTCHSASFSSNAAVSATLDDSESSFSSDQVVCSPVCNICGSTNFSSFGRPDRALAKCCSCQSLERHRALQLTLNRLGLLNPNLKGQRRCLHLAPEFCTYRYLLEVYGAGYLVSDPCPDSYPEANCIKLSFPHDFIRFPSGFFDLIIHNHVMEHLPGSYHDHVNHFYRLLAPNGYMVFTFPDLFYRFGLPSVEGGEVFSSDAERLMLFGQEDHVKWLGLDFVSYLHSMFASVDLFYDPRATDDSSSMASHNAVGIVFACRK
jgi:phosphoglycolate phosphatase